MNLGKKLLESMSELTGENPKSKLSSFLEVFEPLTVRISAIYIYFRHQLPEMIEKMLFWGWKMRKNHDWDYSFMFEMIVMKLERMEKTMKNHGHLVWNQCPDEPEYVDMRALELCIRIGKRLIERSDISYAVNAWEKHEKKWGEYDFSKDWSDFNGLRRKNEITEEDHIQCKKEQRGLYELSSKIRKRDTKNFYSILEKYGFSWWD